MHPSKNSIVITEIPMWPMISRSDERPSRPPSGLLRHGGGNGGRLPPYSGSSPAGSVRSQRSPQRSLSPSVGSRRFHGGNGDSDTDNDDSKDDDSLDTYVSVSTKGGMSRDENSVKGAASTAPSSSSQGKIFRDGQPKSNSESSRVLRETSHASNKPMISRSSSTGNSVVRKMKNQYEGYGGKSSSSSSSNAEILDELKSDINSLELLRSQAQQEEDFPERHSENDFFRLRSTSSFSSSTDRLQDSKNNNGRTNSTTRSPQYDGVKAHDYGGNHVRSHSSMSVGSRGDRVESDEADARSVSTYTSSSPGRLHVSRNNNGRSTLTVRSSQFDGVKPRSYGDNDGRSLSFMSAASRGDRVESDEADSRSTSSFTSPSPGRLRDLMVKIPQHNHNFRVTGPVRTPTKDASTSIHSSRKNKKQEEVKGLEMAAENNELLKQLQETVKMLKEESIKTIEHYESKMSHFSDIQSQLEKSKLKEVEIARTLRGVLSNVESQQCVTSEELSIVYKLRESEVILLEEKLKGALIAIAEKTKAIQKMESDMVRLQWSCQRDREETEQRLYNKMEDLESNWIKKVTKLQHELEESEADYHELNEKKSKILDQLSNTESENRSLHESMKTAKEEAEKAVAAVKKLLKEAKEEKQEEISTLRDSFLVAKEEAQAANEKTRGFKKKIDEMDEANNSLELALAEANIAKVNMELELNNVKGEVENQIHNQIANIEKEKRNYVAQIEKLTTSLSETNANHVQTESAFKTSLEKSKDINAQMSVRIESTEQEIDVLNGLVQEKDKQILKMNQAAATMDKQVITIEAQMNVKLGSAERENDVLKGRVQERDKQFIEMNKIAEMMQMKIQQAEEDIEAKDKKLMAYEEQLMEVKQETDMLHMKVQQAKKEYDALKGEVQEREKAKGRLQKVVDDLKYEVETHKTEIPAFEAKVSRLKADLGEAKTKAMIMEQEVSSLQSELVRINEHLEFSKSGAKERESKLNDTISDLQSELHMAKNNLERNTSAAQERESKLDGTVQYLQSELNMAEENLGRIESGAQERESKLKGTIQDLKSQLHMAKKNLEQTDAKLSTLRTEGDARKGQLKSALQSLDEMMAYITSMRDENDDIVASLEGDLEKAIKIKEGAEREMKKR